MKTRTIKENLRRRLAITATGLALAAASTFAHAHGDVTPQAVDTSSLKQLGEIGRASCRERVCLVV